MLERVIQFVSALRGRGVRISLAESKEAVESIAAMGITDKEIFRLCLRATLIKDAQSLPVFDELFPLYFGDQAAPTFQNAARNLTPDQAKMIAEAIRQYSQQLRKMLNKMILGQPLTQEELEELDRLTNLSNVQDPGQQDWKTRQMMEALQFEEIRKALDELLQLLEKMGMDPRQLEGLRRDLNSNQQALEEQVSQHVGQQIRQNMSQQNTQDRADSLYNRPFQSLTDADMQILRQEVKRLAIILRTRLALRLKRAKSGKLDVKSTMRTNMKYGSVPVEIRHKDRIRKPKLVILCDVSTSMRHCSELMISLLYAIQDQISKTHAFAFIDHLEYISPQLENRQANQAVALVLEAMPSGHYNTDLGHSLDDLNRQYLDSLDHRSTFIVVGDGRNNYNDPRLDLFIRLARRSHSTIWLNPEADSLWGSGDSDMLRYAPHCSRIFQTGNLTELAAAIDHLLIQP
jgi:uncharacterized protein with von Willebrand factor type A (vWA) domain